jgi:predicted dehydrogenase
MIMSFDMWRHSLPCIELYGETGSIQVPDPNGFAGPVFLSQNREDWSEFPHAFPANARMIGVIDMVRAIRSGRQHRASDALAYHVLEVMLAFDKSSESRMHVEIQSSVERPAPLPMGLDEWAVED